MSFLSVLKTIGADIEKGIAIAAQITSIVDPPLSPILAEIAAFLAALEGLPAATSAKMTADESSPVNLGSIVQSVAMIAAVRQATTPAGSKSVFIMPNTNTITFPTFPQGGGSGGGPVPVPDPVPAPIPGGGPQDGYEFLFNQRYYATRDARLHPLAYGIAAGQDGNADALSQDDQTQLANDLYDWKAPGGPGSYGPNHVDFDEQIDYLRQGPYATNYQRLLVDGYQRVPVGTGTTTQPPNVVTKAELIGPPVPGKYLLVTCDINQL